MAETNVVLGPSTSYPTLAPDVPQVWIRERWEDAWQEEPYLRPHKVKWSVQPSMPTAMLTWFYGTGLRPGEAIYQNIEPKDIKDWYVRIKWGSRYWCGIITSAADHQSGVTTVTTEWNLATGEGLDWADGDDAEWSEKKTRSGRQEFAARGLEDLFYRYPIRDCRYFTNYQEQEPEDVNLSPVGLTFNADGKPNKSGTLIPIDEIEQGWEATIFYSQQEPNPQHASGESPGNWSTKDIFDYLFAFHFPRNRAGDIILKFEWNVVDWLSLPEWDKPEVETEGRTVGKLLSQLFSRHRLFAWYIEYDEIEDPDEPGLGLTVDKLTFRIRTYTGEDIELPGGDEDRRISGNDETLAIVTEDATGEASYLRYVIQESGEDVYDQVVVRGANYVTIASVLVDTMVAGWTYDEWLDYNNAGDASPAGDVADQREAADDYRSRDELSNVFSLMRIDPLYVSLLESNYDAFTRELLRDLPLIKPGLAYTASDIQDQVALAKDTPDMKPFLVMPKPSDPTKYVYADAISYGAEVPTVKTDDKFKEFAVSVRTLKEHFALKFEVTQGQPQHVIAMGTTTGDIYHFDGVQPRDETPGQWDYRQGYVTFAFADERRVEARVPEDDDVSEDIDTVRQLVVDAKKNYQHVEMAEDTVYGVGTDGSLQTVPAVTVLRDDSDTLKDLATFAYHWYSVPRSALQVDMGYVAGSDADLIHLADVIETFNNISINTMITEVNVTFAHRSDSSPAAVMEQPKFTFKTAYHELDVMKL